MADIVNAVSIDTMHLLFECVNQILDMEFLFLENISIDNYEKVSK